jgi:RNA polymerase sigma-70 factor (ECF subfamily)
MGGISPALERAMSEAQRAQQQIAKAVSGDRLALQELLLAQIPELSRQIAAKLPSSLHGVLEVEDILNATFIQAFRSIQKLRQISERSFAAWLRTIAENQLRDALKGLQRKKRGGGQRRLHGPAKNDASSMADLAEMLSANCDTPSGACARHEAVQAIQVGIAGLPDDQRAAIRLHVLEGRSLAETAAVINRTPGAVRALVHRAKQQLREGLGHASQWLSGR